MLQDSICRLNIYYLLEHKPSLPQLAKKLGVAYTTMDYWENGKRVLLPFLAKRLLETKQKLDENRRPNGKTPR